MYHVLAGCDLTWCDRCRIRLETDFALGVIAVIVWPAYPFSSQYSS